MRSGPSWPFTHRSVSRHPHRVLPLVHAAWYAAFSETLARDRPLAATASPCGAFRTLFILHSSP
ncbi:hypothetical protein BD777DRAFT_40276 [Yarrowia lipolytica]|nr:hypothetical protein BD777DRAFT_40276 [Yarrowia lipolytica]